MAEHNTRRELSRTPYSSQFYLTHREDARKSARETVPIVLELVQPRSVIDVGCGVGTWLSVFKEHGIDDVLGIDGDYVDKKELQIPEKQFAVFDLEKPFRIDRKFDLVISLEVAEHISAKSARTFVDSLVRLGSVILFSAAIPHQGGTNHINEQWPEYWSDYLSEHGYVAVDCIRKRIWTNDKVKWWYAQNMLIFVQQQNLPSYPHLMEEFEKTHLSQLSIVHPKNYLMKAFDADLKNVSLKKLLGAIPSVALRACWRHSIRIILWVRRKRQSWQGGRVK